MIDCWSFEMENVTTEKPEFCAVCRFCTHEDGKDFVCHNEDSENYGTCINYKKMRKWACRDFTRHTYKDMSLKDALHMETQHDDFVGAYYSHKLPDNDNTYAIVSLAFKTNAALEEWKDANTRLFMEWMNIAKTDGDFKDATED